MIVRLTSAPTLINCAEYVENTFPEEPTTGEFVWYNHAPFVDQALQFARDCDALHDLPPPGGRCVFGLAGPGGFCKFFRWVRCHYQMPDKTVLMDVGCGAGRTMCMWPQLFGSPVIMLGLENDDRIYNRAVDPIISARANSLTPVICVFRARIFMLSFSRLYFSFCTLF
jgi:hypothetical protein